MCCFAQPVVHVGKTKIFARLTGLGTQYLVYEMEYESETPNAMILPIPTASHPTEESAKFVDLSENKNFFKQLDRAFPRPAPPKSFGLPLPTSRAIDAAVPNLVVQEVGEFVASVVPTLKDFDRLDPQFVIPAETWEKIPLYADYSFVVFQLKSLRGKPHPMAFEFKTRMEDKIFFPTVHIHDGEVHRTEEFDHDLYCQHAAYDSKVGDYKQSIDWATGMQRSKDVLGKLVTSEETKGVTADDLLVHRKKMRGELRNEDVVVRATGDPVEKVAGTVIPTGNLGRVVMASALVAAPLAWVIRRRMQRSQATNNS